MIKDVKSSELKDGIVTIVLVLFVLAGVLGWVLNLADIWNLKQVSGEMILRFVGVIIFPIGMVLGYF